MANFQKSAERRRYSWPRVVVICVSGYEALGCLAGGTRLIVAPDGCLMNMPASIMHGTFDNFLWPGVILLCLGLINTYAFITLLLKRNKAWLWSALAMGALAIWFWAETAIILELHWQHAIWGLPVIAGAVAAGMMLGKILHKRYWFAAYLLRCSICY